MAEAVKRHYLYNNIPVDDSNPVIQKPITKKRIYKTPKKRSNEVLQIICMKIDTDLQWEVKDCRRLEIFYSDAEYFRFVLWYYEVEPFEFVLPTYFDEKRHKIPISIKLNEHNLEFCKNYDSRSQIIRDIANNFNITYLPILKDFMPFPPVRRITIISLKINSKLMKIVDEYIKQHYFTTKAEFIRFSIYYNLMIDLPKISLTDTTTQKERDQLSIKVSDTLVSALDNIVKSNKNLFSDRTALIYHYMASTLSKLYGFNLNESL